MRNPKGGYCPRKGYEVEAMDEACACYNSGEQYSEEDDDGVSEEVQPAPIPVRVADPWKADPAKGTKRCSKCGRILPVSAFSKQSDSKDGLQCYCRECFAEVAQERRRYRETALAHYSTDELRRELRRRGIVAKG